MTDRELLELAAKAAGIGPVLCYETARNCLRIGPRAHYRLWRPLNDGEDVLRLAAALEIDVLHRASADEVWAQAARQKTIIEKYGDDKLGATCRAVVRAAAEIGRAMP